MKHFVLYTQQFTLLLLLELMYLRKWCGIFYSFRLYYILRIYEFTHEPHHEIQQPEYREPLYESEFQRLAGRRNVEDIVGRNDNVSGNVEYG